MNRGPIDQNAMTVFGKDRPQEIVNASLHGIDMIRAIEPHNDTDGTFLIVGRDGSEAQLDYLRFLSPGDKFSVLYTSMMNFVNSINERREGLNCRAISRLQGFELSVGIVFCPACLHEDDWRFDIPFSIAQATDGLIFNGYALVDKTGYVVIDANGGGD